MNDDRPIATTRRTGLTRSSCLTLCALAVCALTAAGSGCTPSEPPPAPAPEPTPNVAAEAADYLRAKNADPLSGDLQALLTDPAKKSVPTEQHALLKQLAPTFALSGADDKRVELEALLARGPVVLVFYYGYSCDHCVAQLFGIEKDLRYFTELKATVVGLSPDAPAKTRERYAEYGPFHFPVASDPDRAVAGKYAVFRPAAGDLPKWQAHGTFVIGRDRRVRWVNTGTEPFTDNVTLLRELAAAEGRLPTAPGTGVTP